MCTDQILSSQLWVVEKRGFRIGTVDRRKGGGEMQGHRIGITLEGIYTMSILKILHSRLSLLQYCISPVDSLLSFPLVLLVILFLKSFVLHHQFSLTW